jgi:ABC-type multidrug transport system ATPase subunit
VNVTWLTCAADETHFETTKLGYCVPCNAPVNVRPGFVCENNTISFCPAGFFCPFNESTGSFNRAIKCREGFMCAPGFIEEIPCAPNRHCPAGATRKETSAVGIFLATLAAVFCISLCCCVLRRRRINLTASFKLRDEYVAEADRQLGRGLSECKSPVSIEFKNVGMKLKSNGREILRGVSGYFPPASLVALMGPSGGGKTTFMNALLGRASYANVTGQVVVNGVKNGLENARNLLGFVPQNDDVVHEDLTVFQNIYYSAMTRLPAEVSAHVKRQHVQEVINVLGISHIQNMVVGSAKRRGISGGQKKRVNIGVELAAMPSIIFMDEPTSGLDGSATLELAQCLAELRNSGLSIVCVIHQPRFTVFKEFTHLLLLGAGGRQVYGGRTEHVTTYLGSLGFRIPELENPADWMIDVVCGLQQRFDPQNSNQIDDNFEAPAHLFELWDQRHAATCTAPSAEYNAPAPSPQDMAGCVPLQRRATLGCCKQSYYFSGRQWAKFSIQGFTSTCAALWIAAGLLGNLQIATEYNYFSLYASLPGTPAILSMFCSIQSHSLIFRESLQSYREFKAGMNVSAYFTSKLLFDFVRTFVYNSFWVLSYYMTAAPYQSIVGTGYFWMFLGYCFYWSSFGGWVAVTFRDYTTGLLLLVFLPPIEQLWSGVAAAWLGQDPIRDRVGMDQFISIMSSGRWLNQGLYASEIYALPSHLRDFPIIKETLYNISVSEVAPDAGAGVMATDAELAWGQQEAAIALFGLGMLFRVLTWGSMLLTKFAQGQTRRSQFIFLVGRWLRLCNLACASESEDAHAEDIVVQKRAFRRSNLGSVLSQNPRWDNLRAQVRESSLSLNQQASVNLHIAAVAAEGGGKHQRSASLDHGQNEQRASFEIEMMF